MFLQTMLRAGPDVALSDHEKYVKRECEKEADDDGVSDENHIDIHPAVNHRLKEGETIKINVMNKPAGGTGMLSAAGLSGTVSGTAKPKMPCLAPPPSGAGKVRSPLLPPPNDPVAARITSPNPKGPIEKTRHTTDPFLDLSQLKRNLPSAAEPGSTKGTTASGWAAF